nr:ARID DNA-binding domain-containing protein [Tanacetum cinerariifolium]
MGSSLTSLCFAAHTPGDGLALDADETKSPTNLNGESGGEFKGHIFKSCPAKIKDEVEHAQGHPVEIVEGNIEDGSNGYMLLRVHYAPEITLNILSINLLKQQGFEIIFKGDRCTLEYMFKNQQGQNIDLDKMRQRHNDYLDDYFESLDKEIEDKEGEMARAPEDPTKVEEDSESLKPYQWNIGKTCAVEKGKEKQEHFGIKLEKEEDCKI